MSESPSIKNNRFLYFLSIVEFCMRGTIFKYDKIFRSIISWITINMMHNFFRFKKSIEHFFCDKAMFLNISIFISLWMVRLFKKDISKTCLSTTFPKRMFASGISAFHCFALLSFSFFGKFSPSQKMRFAFFFKFIKTFYHCFRHFISYFKRHFFSFYLRRMIFKIIQLCDSHFFSDFRSSFIFSSHAFIMPYLKLNLNLLNDKHSISYCLNKSILEV